MILYRQSFAAPKLPVGRTAFLQYHIGWKQMGGIDYGSPTPGDQMRAYRMYLEEQGRKARASEETTYTDIGASPRNDDRKPPKTFDEWRRSNRH